MRYISLKIAVAILLMSSGCIGGGTHGYIKRYRYNTSKMELEKVVHHVIKTNPAIQQDTTKNYYNDDTKYITIVIMDESMPYTYTFHFYGGEKYWNTSKTSAISISYAYDEMRNGGSEGNGIKKSDLKLINKLTRPFEKEFVLKIDSIMGMIHTEE